MPIFSIKIKLRANLAPAPTSIEIIGSRCLPAVFKKALVAEIKPKKITEIDATDNHGAALVTESALNISKSSIG